MAADPLAAEVLRWRKDPAYFARTVLGVDTLWKRQVEILEAVRDKRRVAVPSCHESGKALDLDTPLRTPFGWTTMRDVRVGDLLYDEMGVPTRVTACSPIHSRPCYAVRFDDGSEIVASDDHRWSVIDLRHRPRHVVDWSRAWDSTRIVTTREMAESVRVNGQLRWRIPTSRAVLGTDLWPLPIDPYTFGAWLGDGSTASAQLTCHVDDAPHFAEATGGVILAEKTDTVKRVRFRARPTADCPAKLIGGKKRIPSSVQLAGVGDRLEVLRGLMDTDGYLGNKGSVEIAVCDEELADGIEELVTGLGMIARRSSRPAKLYGRVVNTSHRIAFRPFLSPFRLPRKADRWMGRDAACGEQRSRRSQRTIVEIEPVGERPVKCVAVASPRHLYLAGRAMTPTHNTFVASVLAAWWLLAFQPSKVITTAPTQRQVRDLLWSEIRSRHAGMLGRLGGDPGLGAPSLTHWEIAPDWFATGFATSPDKAQENAVRFQGYHSEHLLVILDEAGGIPREVWAAIDGLVTSESSHVLAIGNPAVGTEFERACRSPDWRVLRISAFDCPNLQPGATLRPWGVTPQWVDEMRRRWGEGSVVFQTKVLGHFPESSVDTLLSLADVERALAGTPPQENKLPISIGVDVARFGTDETVIYVLRGPAVLAVESWAGQDTMKTAGRVIALALEHGMWTTDAPRIAVDDTGVGGGVVDRLREQEWRVRAVNFGAAPERSRNEEKFYNRRTELWWDLREWVRKDAALSDLPPETQDVLRADLCAPKYEQRSDGRIALESKDKIRERVGRSPDHGDALALAVAAQHRASRWPIVAPRQHLSPDDEEDDRDDERNAAARRYGRKWGPLGDRLDGFNVGGRADGAGWTPLDERFDHREFKRGLRRL